ncbi:hypothetical protein GOP47_0001225 [Adiantum capillus-veneris]|uniref:Uncharacterized protein n=1 Tax=Adiantum capillus-veneris TaxID=13818 RepID=A0A9D4VG83_ADICA|nr:hypothetical protein GOP47_0001225 [Adiantum capillus-veneris]
MGNWEYYSQEVSRMEEKEEGGLKEVMLSCLLKSLPVDQHGCIDLSSLEGMDWQILVHKAHGANLRDRRQGRDPPSIKYPGKQNFKVPSWPSHLEPGTFPAHFVALSIPPIHHCRCT